MEPQTFRRSMFLVLLVVIGAMAVMAAGGAFDPPSEQSRRIRDLGGEIVR